MTKPKNKRQETWRLTSDACWLLWTQASLYPTLWGMQTVCSGLNCFLLVVHKLFITPSFCTFCPLSSLCSPCFHFSGFSLSYLNCLGLRNLNRKPDLLAKKRSQNFIFNIWESRGEKAVLWCLWYSAFQKAVAYITVLNLWTMCPNIQWLHANNCTKT